MSEEKVLVTTIVDLLAGTVKTVATNMSSIITLVPALNLVQEEQENLGRKILKIVDEIEGGD